MRKQALCVLHVAALEDADALQALSRTVRVMATLGVEQVLLALEGRARGDAAWGGALAAEVRRLRCAGLGIAGRIRALESEFAGLVRQRALYAVHLHGVVACLLGARALRRVPLQGRVVCSLHGLHFVPHWAGALLGRLLRRHLSPFHYAPLAVSLTEAEALSKLLNRSAEVLPQPVDDVFFETPREEAARPGILAQGSGAEPAEIVTRLGVLLNARAARVEFAWLGAASARTLAQLAAVSIRVPEVADERERARWLSQAWLFIDMTRRDPRPLGVAQAMAAGVPCLVSDIPAHRGLIHHGETGCICTSERDLLERVVLLMRDRSERARMGEAARAEAARRFTERSFERALLRAYGLLGGEAFVEDARPAG